MTNLTDPAQKSADPAEAFERAIEKSVAGPLGKLGESMKGLTEGQAELAKRLATVEETQAKMADPDCKRAMVEAVVDKDMGSDSKSLADDLAAFNINKAILGAAVGWQGGAKDLGEYRVINAIHDSMAAKSRLGGFGQVNKADTHVQGVDSLGGFFVPPTVMVERFIPKLTEALFLSQLGITTMVDLPGTEVSMPREIDDLDAGWGSEISEPGESVMQFGELTMRPKYLKTIAKTSRRLLRSAPQMSGIVTDRIARKFSQMLETAAINGTGGTNQPVGVLNQQGIQTYNWTAVAPNYSGASQNIQAKLDDIYGLLADSNAAEGNLGHTFRDVVRRKLRTVKDADGLRILTSTMAGTQDPSSRSRTTPRSGTIEGMRYVTNELVGQLEWVFGNWSDLVLGYFETMFLEVNTQSDTAFRRGEVHVKGEMAADIGIYHAESFVSVQNFAL